jgi:hypothetical protein
MENMKDLLKKVDSLRLRQEYQYFKDIVGLLDVIYLCFINLIRVIIREGWNI